MVGFSVFGVISIFRAWGKNIKIEHFTIPVQKNVK